MKWLVRMLGPGVPTHKRALRIALLVLLLLACGLRAALVIVHNPLDAIFSDPGRHWTLGTRPLDMQAFAAIDPIGYHVYLAVLAKVTSGSRILVAYWTVLLSLSTPWLWYRFLRELQLSRDWALTGWVLFAALPTWSVIYSYFMQETLMLPLLGAALWTTWRARRKRDRASFLLAVFVWICAGMTRAICIPLAAVAMIWVWFERDRKLTNALTASILLLAVLGPLSGRSWFLAREISPYGLGEMNQLYAKSGAKSFTIDIARQHGKERWGYIFQSPSIDSTPLAPLSDWNSHRMGRVHFTVDLDKGHQGWESAKAVIPSWTLDRYAWITGDNVVLLFFGESWPDSNRSQIAGLLNYWSRWLWAPLALVCVIATGLRLRALRRHWLLPVLILIWFIVQGLLPLAVNEGRYRKPFEALLVAQCLLVASSVTGLRRTRRENAGRRHANIEVHAGA